MAITKTEIRKVITRLDDVKIELLRLRAQLLPEEAPTPSERRLIREGRREIEKGHYVTFTQLRKELGV
jgi:ribosomal protein L29